MRRIYPDANIFLAQWKGNSVGVKPFADFARNLFKEMLEEGNMLVVSDLTYEEVTKKFPENPDMPSVLVRKDLFEKLINGFKEKGLYLEVKGTEQDRIETKKLFRKYKLLRPSAADLTHISIAKRVGAILLTEDRLVMEICEEEGIMYETLF